MSVKAVRGDRRRSVLRKPEHGGGWVYFFLVVGREEQGQQPCCWHGRWLVSQLSVTVTNVWEKLTYKEKRHLLSYAWGMSGWPLWHHCFWPGVRQPPWPWGCKAKGSVYLMLTRKWKRDRQKWGRISMFTSRDNLFPKDCSSTGPTSSKFCHLPTASEFGTYEPFWGCSFKSW